MNLSHLKNADSYSKNLLEAFESMIIPSKHINFCGPYFRQNWLLPDSIVFYIAKNPSSSKMYEKAVNCCKYFFFKNPIFVISNLVFYFNNKWETSCGNIELERTNTACKFWVNGKFGISHEKSVSSLITKIYRCEFINLFIIKQIISFKEFLFLTPSAEVIRFFQVTVKYEEDDSIVPFEKIVDVMPAIKHIVLKPNLPNVTSNTFKEMLKIPHFSKIEHIYLNNMTEVFDIEAFYNFMKTNKQTNFFWEFTDSISQAYKNRLESIIDEILAAENHDYKVPSIQFPGLDDNKYFELAFRLT